MLLGLLPECEVIEVESSKKVIFGDVLVIKDGIMMIDNHCINSNKKP